MSTGKDPEILEWTVRGMDCASCTAKIRDALKPLPGVADVRISIMNERLQLRLDDDGTGPDRVETIVRSLGYDLTRRGEQGDDLPVAPDGSGTCTDSSHDHVDHQPAPDDRQPWYRTSRGRLVIGLGGVIVLAWIIDRLVPAAGPWAFALACILGLIPVARRAWAALRLGQPFTIEALMTIAAIGALAIGAGEEAALVVFLFIVGEMLEGVAANRARDGIRALAALVPRTAMVEDGGALREVAAASLAVGQVVLVRPGDRVPADGTILEGSSEIDDSPVTGESVPVFRRPGDAVHAGSINTDAALRVRVDKAAADNTIARIIRLVEEADEARAPTERFIDRFSRWYMPLIVVLAALVMVIPPLAADQSWSVWTYRGLALLLIGCPCALVISVPASIASSLSVGARNGLLLKGGSVIEALAAVRHVAFDKTGTLTVGRPQVTDIVVLDRTLSQVDLMARAAAVEAGSSHPLARAIVLRAAGMDAPGLSASDLRAVPGKGVEGLVEGRMLGIWSPGHAHQQGLLDTAGLAAAAAMEEQGKTVVVLCDRDSAAGLIAMRDEPRPDARGALDELHAMGLQTIMLTGDNPRTAAAIADGLGIEARAGLLPEAKLEIIRSMAGAGGVAMVGDGINDAPALRQASVGLAMGSGTDVALETADGAILRDRMSDVPAAIALARLTMTNIRQNITLALGLKAVFLVTSVLGVTGLWVAILADTGATVLVTLNALRLLRHRPGPGGAGRGE